MKLIHTLLAVLVASLVAVSFTFAGEGGDVKRQIKLMVGDGDVVEADVSDLEVGQSRQFWAGDKEILVTNTDDGLKIEIDGEEVNIGGPHGHGNHEMELHSSHGDSHQVFTSTNSKVIVKHLDSDEGGHGYHFIGEDGEGVDIDIEVLKDGDWIDEDGEHRVIMFGGGHGMGGDAAATHLEASGVLDDLDTAKRDEILEALRTMEGPHVEVKKKVIVVREEIED